MAAAARACIGIAAILRTAPLDGLSGVADSTNVHGETQKPLDVKANDIFVECCSEVPALCVGVSEEVEGTISFNPAGTHAILFDPLDGSSNLDVNVTVGSIFSVVAGRSVADILGPGTKQLAAGFAAYGPATTLVITFGSQVDLFVLKDGEFYLSQTDLRIPEETAEFAINTSRQRLWSKGIARYVADCVAGEEGPLGKRYNMRWVGSMVAEVQRILARGGVFLYPADTETLPKGGRLRLLYEARPMAMIVEAAGGGSLAGRTSILDLPARELHQRVPVILGSWNEIRGIAGYTDAD